MLTRFAFSVVPRKQFLACSVLLAIVAGYAAPPAEPIRVPSNALTDAARQNLIGGFTYDLPAGWSLKSIQGTPFKVAFGRAEDGDPANISFQVIAFTGNIGEFEASMLKQLPSAYEKMGLTNSRVINLSGFETSSKLVGLRAVVEAERLDGKTARQILYFFERKDGQKICVTCSVADEGNRYDPIFDSIMKTFSVTK